MKNIILITIFSSASFFAQSNFYLSSNMGLNLSYPKAPFNNVWGISYNLGIGIGYNFSEDLSTEIIYQFSKHKLSTISIDGKTGYQFINSYLIRWNYILLNNHSIKTFVSLGIGISNMKLYEEKDNGIFSLFPGIGIEYKINEHFEVKIFGEFAYIDDEFFPMENLKYFPVQLGFKYNM
ncbi:MAG: porin family protein [Melioribacteraceae bacterium]|nr:porin family protein [Melioribacteraceae bacterium]MCF8356915.1 porin family protein [Melioribacteraceae bacterium]MCF8418154.1 porin family protein [Melioribacteraceae bacterium]